jgi:hypothetical protein
MNTSEQLFSPEYGSWFSRLKQQIVVTRYKQAYPSTKHLSSSAGALGAPRKYWNDLKKKLVAEGYVEVSEKIGQLKLLAPLCSA